MSIAEKPLVGVITGTDSDLKTVKPIYDILTGFSVLFGSNSS